MKKTVHLPKLEEIGIPLQCGRLGVPANHVREVLLELRARFLLLGDLLTGDIRFTTFVPRIDLRKSAAILDVQQTTHIVNLIFKHLVHLGPDDRRLVRPRDLGVCRQKDEHLGQQLAV